MRVGKNPECILLYKEEGYRAGFLKSYSSPYIFKGLLYSLEKQWNNCFPCLYEIGVSRTYTITFILNIPSLYSELSSRRIRRKETGNFHKTNRDLLYTVYKSLWGTRQTMYPACYFFHYTLIIARNKRR